MSSRRNRLSRLDQLALTGFLGWLVFPMLVMFGLGGFAAWEGGYAYVASGALVLGYGVLRRRWGWICLSGAYAAGAVAAIITKANL